MNPADRLADTLRQLRQSRRLSQLALSLTLGVSQRHISFVEQGRAQPSRALLMAWLQALKAPLAQRNAALLQAGFAPAYGDATQGDPGLAQVEWALRHLLHAHDPLPALVVDAHWRAELALQATLAPRIAAVEAALQARVGHGQTPVAPLRSPVLTTRFASPLGELAFFSMFTTFGTPQDIHLASLRVEHLFAANEATRQALEREVPR